MRAGALDRKVTVQSRTVTQDPNYGSEVEVWGTFATAWVRFDETGGQEQERNNREFTSRNAVVQMRFIDGINADMRLIEPNGSIWQILNVSMKKRRADLRLEVIEYARG